MGRDKKKKRDRSSGARSDSDSDGDARRDRKRALKEQKKRDKMDEKRRRRLDEVKKKKRAETPEEKLARKMAKQKEKNDSFFGYTPEDNPFGDANLHDQFVWHKKYDKASGRAPTKKELVNCRVEQLDEIKKVRERRDAREKEKEELERLKEEEMRLREAQDYDDYHRREEEFFMQQARLSSHIRIKEGRERPIDIMAKNILLFSDANRDETSHGQRRQKIDTSHLELELREPYKMFAGLPLDELLELDKEIGTYKKLHEEGTDAQYYKFWECLAIISKHEVVEAKRLEKEGHQRDGPVHSAVNDDMHKMLEEKSLKDLEKMEKDVSSKLEDAHTGFAKGGAVDVEYWEGLLSNILQYKAKAYLKDFHETMLMNQLELLEQRKKALQEKRAAEGGSSVAEPDKEDVDSDADDTDDKEDDEDDGGDGDFSPELFEVDEDIAMMAEDPDKDRDTLEQQRQDILEQERSRRESAMGARQPSASNLDSSNDSRKLWAKEESKGMDANEELLGDEVDLAGEVYLWHDKYRPRKPRYFNRVKTGYDWNKYNQTHYDHDNPPPKSVQGYKFNVFYPDILDKTKTPTFRLEPTDHGEFVIIRFMASAPYEDLAFKIINGEWEYSHKRGFKCVYERGIMQLYFNFRRHRYRS